MLLTDTNRIPYLMKCHPYCGTVFIWLWMIVNMLSWDLMCRTILTTHCHISTFNKHWSSCSTVSSSPLELMSLVLSVFSPVYHTVSAHCSAQTELRSGYWHRNTSAGASQLTPDHETMVTWCSSEAVTHQPCSPLNMTTWLMSPISPDPGHHQLHSFILVSSAPGNVEQFRIQNIINLLSI